MEVSYLLKTLALTSVSLILILPSPASFAFSSTLLAEPSSSNLSLAYNVNTQIYSFIKLNFQPSQLLKPVRSKLNFPDETVLFGSLALKANEPI